MQPFLENKFDTVVPGAAAVTAVNKTLATHAGRLNSNTQLLLTVIDTARYVATPRLRSDIFAVGWIGLLSTAPYLSELVGSFSLIGQESPVWLVIGGKAPSIPNASTMEVDLSEQTEVALINFFDVGIMPLSDENKEYQL